jgi:glycosyltransferase involved in cell wall biosynthesis
MDVSIVIPTHNMREHVQALWKSLQSSGLAELCREIIVVDDGSTDGTGAFLQRLQEVDPLAGQKLKLAILPQNVGRFEARHQGAMQARSANLLFLDSRLTLPLDFAAELDAASAEHPSIVGSVDIDIKRNNFCLYWDRSHKFVFRNHFKHAHNPIELTPKNFDDFLSGTGCFLVPRHLFLEACDAFKGIGLLSDDTLLMKRISASVPITVHPRVRVGWVPRETFREFVWRMWDRGPGFVEYHVFEIRGRFFWFVVGGLAAAVGLSWLLVAAPYVGLPLTVLVMASIPASTALLAKSPGEFITLVPIHSAVVMAFAAGTLRGLVVNIVRKVRAWRGETMKAIFS